MIITKTYASKSNTIIRDSLNNMGINPVMELNYGKMLSRGLFYFDHKKVKELVEDKTYPNINKLHHILKIKNTASITSKNINKPCFTADPDGSRLRAQSFDIIFFHLPNDWDQGRGFDYIDEITNLTHRGITIEASNWYQYKNYYPWDTGGVYSTKRMSKEMDLFTSKEGNLSQIIFGYQHFDCGNEDIELDITCTFNKFIIGELENHGFGIMFSPMYEEQELPKTQYVGFFTQHTHTFFEPYIETRYEDVIEDDRTHFYLDKDNKLYFYAMVGGQYVNLDEIPQCFIDGEEYSVEQASKGIYYAEVNLSSSRYENETMVYDVWSNLSYKGESINDVNLSFVTKAPQGYYSFGLPNGSEDRVSFVPSVYGINFDERIKQGDIRKVNIDCRIPYTGNQLLSVDGLEYRLYVLEAERQCDAIGWAKVDRGYNENYFLLNTNDLVPMRYYVDIRVKDNLELKYYYKVLQFDIISDITKEAV